MHINLNAAHLDVPKPMHQVSAKCEDGSLATVAFIYYEELKTDSPITEIWFKFKFICIIYIILRHLSLYSFFRCITLLLFSFTT